MRNYGLFLILAAVLYVVFEFISLEMHPCNDDVSDSTFMAGIGPCFSESMDSMGRMVFFGPLLLIPGIVLVAWDFFAKKQAAVKTVIRPSSDAPKPEEDDVDPIGGDEISKIAKLSELHKVGAISDAEFERKKAELLDRL